MTSYKIPLSYTPFDPEGLKKVLERYERQPQMQLVYDFEKEVQEYTGARYAVALSSGTAGIHLALKAAGVGPGDEVLVSSFTYVATVNPILYLGASPVFIDSELTTWNMDPALLEEALDTRQKAGRKPKAIVIVHAYGMPAQMGKIMAISAKYGVLVIEDAAEALGSELNGKKLGTLGYCGVYSFNNNKIMTTYGGGALVTNDHALYQNVLLWASQSRENKPYYEHKEIGYNYRMGPLSAAQGLASFGQLGHKIARRREIFEFYRTKLRTISELVWLMESDGYFSNRWLTTVLLPNKGLGAIQDKYLQRGIETRPLWNPMDEQPVFQTLMTHSSGTAARLFSTGLTLPSSDHLTEAEMENIVEVIFTALGYGKG